MKLISAIIRPEKFNDVLTALYRIEVRGLTVTRIQGHGGEMERVETYRGTTVQMSLNEKLKVEIAVSESFVEPAVQVILEAARTGDVGDGKVFVSPIEKIYRIRTGEQDRNAVTPVRKVAAGLN